MLDRLYPQLWVGVQTQKVERDRQEVFSLGVASSALGQSASRNLLLLAKARALSKQWVVPRGVCRGWGGNECVEGHWGCCLTSSVLKGVHVKG